MTRRLLCTATCLTLCWCFGTSVQAASPTQKGEATVAAPHGGEGLFLTADQVAEAAALWEAREGAGGPRGVGCTAIGYQSLGTSASISSISNAGGDNTASVWTDVELDGSQFSVCEIDVNVNTTAGVVVPYTATLEIWDGFPLGNPCDTSTVNMLGSASAVVNAAGAQLVTFTFSPPIVVNNTRPGAPPACGIAVGAQFGNADFWVRWLSTDINAGPVLAPVGVQPTIGCSDGAMGFCQTGNDGLFGGFFALDDGRFSMEVRVTDTPPGACCNSFGAQACTDGTDQQTCEAGGGVFLGPDSVCAAGSCDGACCVGVGCQIETFLQCETIFGVYQGVGTDCAGVDPCLPQACCDEFSQCSNQAQNDCINNGGAFFPGEFCEDMPAPNCPTSEVSLAPVVDCNTTYNTNNAALLNPGDPGFVLNPDFSCIAGDGAGEFWVSFIADDTSAFISTQGSGVVDTIIEVHTGPDAFSLTPVPNSCVDDDVPGSNFHASTCIATTIGQQYWVLVASFAAANPDKGPISVLIQCPCPATCDTCPGDVNADEKLDGGDIQQFTRCLIGAEPSPDLCVCADMDDDGDADIADVAPFVAAILNGGFCPGFPSQSCPVGHSGQLPDLENALASNANANSGTYADNFDTVTGGTITEINWWGVYLGAGACPDSGDSFTITIHNDDNNGIPGSVVATLSGQTPTRVATGRVLLGAFDEFQYTLSGLNINLIPGCYWLSISNLDSAGGCSWFWSSSNDGDAIAAVDPDGTGYLRIDGTDPVADDNDTAWCLDIAIGDNSTCVIPQGACCQNGACIGTLSEAACLTSNGSWFIGEDCNAGFICPSPLACNEIGQCQQPDLINGFTSDTDTAFPPLFESFTATSAGNINSICWWGAYLASGCEATTPDTFSIRYFDNTGVDGTPGNPISPVFTSSGARLATGSLLAGLAPEYMFTAQHPDVPVAAGQCVWIGIVQVNGDAGCQYFWETSQDGDAIHFAGDGTLNLVDLAFCVNLPISANADCPVLPTGACCVSAVCQATNTLPECNGLGGNWFLGEDCATFNCPIDGADTCMDPLPTVTDGTSSVDLTTATDSNVQACNDFPFGTADNIFNDLYFSYTASCTGTLFVDTCGTDIDTRLAIYDVDCTAIGGGALPIECNDDHSEAAEGDTGNVCPFDFSASLSVPVTAGNTYVIRVGVFDGAALGLINLNINCAAPGLGACCTGATCTDVTNGVTECDGLGGVYQGDGTACATTTCGGACCLPNETCVSAVNGTDCIDNLGGAFFWGDGVACADVIGAGACPTGVGAGQCVYQLVLFDSFGDGWNNGGPENTIDVFLNGVSAFGGPVTLPDGDQGFIFFNANPGDVITTTYVAMDTFEEENAWVIFDGYGNVTCADLGGAAGPDQTPMLPCSTACP